MLSLDASSVWTNLSVICWSANNEAGLEPRLDSVMNGELFSSMLGLTKLLVSLRKLGRDIRESRTRRAVVG